MGRKYSFSREPINFTDKPKQKVNSASPGDIVRTPTSHPEDFIRNGKIWKNKYTNELWEKSTSTHSDKNGEWKIGLNGQEPRKMKKITVGISNGKIIKYDNK